MSEQGANRVDIYARTEQVGGSGLTDGEQAHSLVGQGWNLRSCLFPRTVRPWDRRRNGLWDGHDDSRKLDPLEHYGLLSQSQSVSKTWYGFDSRNYARAIINGRDAR